MKLTSAQYRQLGDIQAQIETLENQRDTILNGNAVSEVPDGLVGAQMPQPVASAQVEEPENNSTGPKRGMSKAGRKRIAEAQRARWARWHERNKK